METSRMIELLHNYPFWFRAVVAGLCVFAGIAAAGLLLITPAKNSALPTREPVTIETSSEKLPAAPAAPTSQEAIATDDARFTDALVSYSAYKKRLAELRNRYIEREEFVQSTRGRTVTWSGYVHDMRGVSSGSKIVVSLKAEPKSPDIFFADIPGEMRVKAAALQEHDRIVVTGKLDNSMQSVTSVEATEFRRVEQ